ncbi:MAG: hypothetical protein KAR23_04865 [Candidatus Aenigmarchaeota archaeon]|nr:hypothetical protein [Candidatus Aenigmarchaeota archaeon]
MRNVMQIFIAAIVTVIILFPSSSFSLENHVFDSYSVSVNLKDDNAHYEYDIVAFFDEAEIIHEFLFTTDARNVKVSLNDVPVYCDVSYAVGSSTASCDMSEALYGRNYISVSYSSRYPLFDIEDMVMFHDSFSFGGDAISSRLSVKLPMGYVLPEKSDYFITPTPDSMYSDGRRHILVWESENVSDLEVSVIFERSSGGAWQSLPLIFLSFLIFLFLVFHMRQYLGRKKKEKIKRIVYSHLLESEAAVVDALEANMGVLKQKELLDITSFSKAKLSRVISNLESRGIVEKKQWGNSNKIFLVKEKNRKKKADEEDKMHPVGNPGS